MSLMSDGLYSDEYDDESGAGSAQTGSGGPKALRDAYEQEKAARKALEDRLAAIEQESRRTKLASALKDLGVKPDELGDSLDRIDPEKVVDEVAAWKRAFGLGQDTPTEPQGSTVDEAERQRLSALSGEPAGAFPASSQDDLAGLQGIQSEAEFWAKIRQLS